MSETSTPADQHKPTTRMELGYSRRVCGTCGCDWPCPPSVMRTCENLNLAHKLPCNCGHHAVGIAADAHEMLASIAATEETAAVLGVLRPASPAGRTPQS